MRMSRSAGETSGGATTGHFGPIPETYSPLNGAVTDTSIGYCRSILAVDLIILGSQEENRDLEGGTGFCCHPDGSRPGAGGSARFRTAQQDQSFSGAVFHCPGHIPWLGAARLRPLRSHRRQ